MNNKQVIAIALAAIIVVAGVVVFMIRGDSSTESNKVSGELLIYGNADGDSNLDNDDIVCLESMIKKEREVTTYADANQDGSITEEDVELVKKLIAGESTTAYYYDQLNNCSESFKYPIKTIYPISIDSNLATKILGLEKNMVAVSSATMDSILFKDVYDMNLPNLGTKPSVEQISEIAGGLDAIIANTYASDVPNEDALEASGAVKVIRLGFNKMDNTAAYLTYGFMTQTTERAEQFVQFTTDVLKTIADATANVSDDDRVRSLVLGYNIIYGKQQNYGTIISNAGGIDVVDWDAYRKCSDGYDWLYAYDFDYIVGLANPAGYDYDGSQAKVDECISIWDKHYDRYEKTQAAQNGNLFILDNNLPIIIKTAYVAQMFYPDLVGADFGEKIHQEYLDKFIGNMSDYKVSDGVFMLTSEFISKLKSSA